MNCPKCGSQLAQGAMFCPVCNETVAANYQQGATQGYNAYQQPSYQQNVQQTGGFAPVNGYQPNAQQTGNYAAVPQGGYQDMYAQQQPGYGSMGGYQQNYAQYAQQAVPPGYQQPYTYGQESAAAEGNALLNKLSDLPHTFVDCFVRPTELLRGMLEKRDLFTCPIVTGLLLLLAFLGGMVVLRSFIGVFFVGFSTLTGVSIAGNAASMNQGVSYIAGRIAPAVGGIVVLCQLIGMIVPAAVMMVYLCALCKVRFSWELLFGFVSITTLPTVAVTLLAMLLSLLSPWAALLVVFCGMAVSYTQAGALLGGVTGRSQEQMVPAKMICICLSLTLTLVLSGVVGGVLMGGVMQRVLVLLSNVGSLI